MQYVSDKFLYRLLNSKRDGWNKWNVPFKDGEFLKDLVIRTKSKQILEIGTSIGHSTIWLAWGAMKNEGKVLTLEKDVFCMEKARKNIKEAGLSKLVLQCQTDAIKMLPHIKTKFDFIFSDADRTRYINFFQLCEPLFKDNTIFITHNVVSNGGDKIGDYLEFLQQQTDYETHIINVSQEGFALTFKKGMFDIEKICKQA